MRLSQGSIPTNPTASKPVVHTHVRWLEGRCGAAGAHPYPCWWRRVESWWGSLPAASQGPATHECSFQVTAHRLAVGCRGADTAQMCRRMSGHIARAAASSSPELQLDPGKRACYQMLGLQKPSQTLHQCPPLAQGLWHCLCSCLQQGGKGCLSLPATAFCGAEGAQPDPLCTAAGLCRKSC